MKRFGSGVAVALLLISIGCVITTKHTIDAHITLDIRHIKEQADDVLDYIEGKSDTLPGLGEEPAADKTSRLKRTVDWLTMTQPVYAEELKDSSPRVKQIAEKLRERNPLIEALKQDGCLGENNRGYVELRECETAEDPEKKNEMQRLLAEENADRKALYNEIARLNKEEGVTVSAVERVYAQARLSRAKSGEIFQMPPEGEHFDAFKASELGKKLGEECVPKAWVIIP